MSSSAPTIDSVIAVVAALELPDLAAVPDAQVIEVLQQVEQLGRQTDALRVLVAGEVAQRSRRELGSASLARKHGAQSAAALVEKFARVSSSEAARRVRLANDTAGRSSLTGEPLPARFEHVAQALNAGDLGMDAALTITRNLAAAERRASIEHLHAGEQWLVAEASRLSADLVGVSARAWRAALDPDGAEPRDQRLRSERSFTIGRERPDGMTPFWGVADPVSAAELRSAVSSRTAPDQLPRFLPEEERLLQESALHDPRSRDQRSFDILLGLLRAGVGAESSTTSSLRTAPNVMVVVREADLGRREATAWVSDVREPISGVTAGTIACDAGIQKVLVGTAGQPLALGRRERFFTAAQRKVLAVRDGGCAWTGCTAPPSWTHAHHVIPWSHDGPTDVDNGVLLCSFHHHLVHEGEFEIRMFDGMPHLRAPLHLEYGGEWRPMGRPRAVLAA